MFDPPATRLFDEARDRLDLGDFEGAARLLEESVELDPHYKSLELLGRCWIELGRPNRAIVALAAATALNEQPRAPLMLARILLDRGKRAEARRLAQMAVDRLPHYGEAVAFLRELDASVD